MMTQQKETEASTSLKKIYFIYELKTVCKKALETQNYEQKRKKKEDHQACTAPSVPTQS